MKKSLLVTMMILMMVLVLLISAQAVEAKRAVLLTVQKLGDKGPVDLLWEGMQRGGEEFGWDETRVIEVMEGEYEDATRTMADLGYDLLVCTFPNMIDAVREVAPDYPDQKFVLIVADVEDESMTNVMSMFGGMEQECCFPAGVVAGLMTQNDHIGFIGGVDNPQINRFFAGYEQGAKLVNPDVKIEVAWVGSFEDPIKAKELSIVQIDRGVDVMFHGSARSGYGMFEACEEAGIMAIGSDNDQCPESPNVMGGSMRIFFEKWVYIVMEDLDKGIWNHGSHLYGLDSGLIGWTWCANNEDRLFPVSQDVIDKTEELMDKVKSGEIVLDPIPERLK